MADSRASRVLAVTLGAATVAALIVLYVVALTNTAQSVASVGGGRGRTAQLTLQTVAQLGPGYENADWVSYLAKDPRRGWVHSTSLTAPAHALVRVTIYQYDTSTGLRNPFFARAQGTTGGTVQLDGKTVEAVPPASPAHTFAIPELGVYVPLPGVSDDARNQCAAAPCTLAEAHHTITFTFHTKGPGRFRWQCFVPCGAGFETGFGGPMQTYGYMAGYLTVV